MDVIKKKNSIEKWLCIFIILCPILDMASFLFRNYFHTSISVTTIVRPIIPAIIFALLFWQVNKKEKLCYIGIGALYVIYGAVHLWMFQKVITRCFL